jgi:hypothetical protein
MVAPIGGAMKLLLLYGLRKFVESGVKVVVSVVEEVEDADDEAFPDEFRLVVAAGF